MFKSIFWKQFAMYIGTLVLSFLLLAAATSQAFRGYFISRREQDLQEQAGKIVDIMTESFGRTSNLFSTITFQQRLADQVKNIQSYMDASVMFIDADYRVFMTTADAAQFQGLSLPEELLAPVMRGNVVSVQGQLAEEIPMKLLTVAYPIKLGHDVAGAVVLNASIPELEQTISDVVRITVLCMVVAAVVAFVCIYLFSRTIINPILAMNDAAKVMAGGDFEKRIQVRTRDEVGQLGESFNNMAESLSQQDSLRREFISNISHDLRTPLTSMRGFLEALLDGTAPKEQTERYLRIVLEETGRLTELANDILDLNKLQSAEVDLTYSIFDVNELIAKTARVFETRMSDGGIVFNMELMESPGNVRADYEKIQRVVYNLLDNGVKFTPEGGCIAVKTELAGKKILVRFIDSGCGIAPEQQKRVFDRFYKADASRGEHKSGSGLGLSIVQAFVKAHGEELTLKSALGDGSEFAFTLTLV